MPQVLTIILNWRTPQMTLRSVESALTALQGIDGALTIVDNDSADGSYETILAEVTARGWDKGPQQVRVLQSGHNGGFGAGNNFGIRAGLPGGARPDYVYVLNSDAFPAPNAIRSLLDHLEAHPQTGLAGSFIHGTDGVPHQTAFRFPSIAAEFEGQIRLGLISRLLKRWVVAMDIPNAPTRVDWLAGASMLMRQSVLDKVGIFDETFFLYFEETDLCRRVAKAGAQTDYVPASRVAHIGSASTGMKTWTRIPGFWLDSRLHYLVKNHGRLYAALSTLALLAGGMFWRLRLLIQTKNATDPPHYLRDVARHALRAVRLPFFSGKASEIVARKAAGGK